MKASVHFYSSWLLGGIVYKLSQSVGISMAAFLSTILIDIDHVFDFIIFSGEKFSIKNIFSWCNHGRW